jgi:peptidyl-prolyl cis-trans isomerase C
MKLPAFVSDRSTTVKIAAVVVAVALVIGGVVGLRATRGLPDDAAFAYGDQIVTQADLDRRMEVLHALYGVQKPTGKAEQSDFRRASAKAVAVSMVLDEAARDKDVVISEKSARDTLDKMVAQQLGSDPEKAFTDLLSNFGVSEDDVLQEVSRQQAIARLFQVVTEDVVAGVKQDDAQAWYDKDPARFATPERRKLANIVVATRAEAAALVKRLDAGAGFAALARAESLDDATRDQGGALGTVAASELQDGYAAIAFKAKDRTVFGPVQTDDGWNVGIVLGVVPAAQPAFAKVEKQVTESLRSDRALKTWRTWLKKRIEKADIEYAAAYLPAEPNEPPALAGDLP